MGRLHVSTEIQTNHERVAWKKNLFKTGSQNNKV